MENGNGYPRSVPTVADPDDDGCLVLASFVVVHFAAAVGVAVGVVTRSASAVVWPFVVLVAWWMGVIAGHMARSKR